MNTLKKLAFPILISTLIVIGARLWYEANQVNDTPYSVEEAIGYAMEVSGVVERNQLSYNQGIIVGDEIYENDLIYTKSQGYLTLRLLSGHFIDFDSNTSVRIIKRQNKTVLVLKVGSLNVHTFGKKGGLDISATKYNEISSDNADFVVSKQSLRSQSVTLSVSRGQLYATAKDKLIKIGSGKSGTLNSVRFRPFPGLQVTSPKKPLVYLDKKGFAKFTWKKHALPPGYAISLYIGKTKSSLKATPFIPKNGSEIQAKISAGKWFWKLVGKNKKHPQQKTIESFATLTKFNRRTPPTNN